MEVFYKTHIGNRKNNEDSLLLNTLLVNDLDTIPLKKYSSLNKTINKFIICDGIGGYSSGEIASKLVLNTFSKQFRKIDKALILNLIYNAKTNLEYYSIINNISKLGTTIAGVIFNNNSNILFNIGDTRIYKITKNSIFKLSKDHSLAQELVDKKQISEEFIRYHKSRNILTSSISGGENTPISFINIETFNLNPGEIILICTDGVWEQFDDSYLFKYFSSNRPFKDSIKVFTRNLIDSSPKDNFSFIVIKK